MKKGYIAIGLAAFFFSTMEIALKGVSLALAPLQLNFLRFAVGALVLLPFALKGLRSKARLGWRDLGFFALGGFVCVVLSMTLYQLSITRAPASVVAVIFSCNPLFLVPLAALVLGETLDGKKILSLGLSLVGIAVIAAPAFEKAGALDPLGIVLTILSAMVFAVYGLFGRARGSRYGSVALTCLCFFAGSLELLGLIGLSHVPALARGLEALGLGGFARVPVFAGITVSSLPLLLYIAIGVTGAGYAFYFMGMEATSAQVGSLVFFIKPALAPILAWLILGEAVGPAMVLGIVLILAGSLLGILGGKARATRGPGA